MQKTSIQYVRDIPKNFVFTSHPNDVRLILETIGQPRARVDSVFTRVSGGGDGGRLRDAGSCPGTLTTCTKTLLITRE